MIKNSSDCEFSIVMPCLNEERTLGTCINKVKTSFKKIKLQYEIVVADNGSTDKSISIATKLGARVVHVDKKGYGAALQGGIEKSLGKYIIMGDSDDSYDFSKLEPFTKNLREGYDLVMGNRFAGKIMSGAMPPLHRLIGNPFFSFIGRLFFGSKVGDFYCGLRGFSKKAWSKMDLQSTGMEYAIEMVIKASLLKMKTTEVPIVLHVDGRLRSPHLNTWKDGWRTLLFMLIFAPRWLFFLPGLTILTVSLLLFCLAWSQSFHLFGINLDVNTLLVSATFISVGLEIVLLGIFTHIFISKYGLLPLKNSQILTMITRDNLAYTVVLGIFIGIIGILLLLMAVYSWYLNGFGNLDYRSTMRIVIPAVLFILLGVQLFFNSFFLGLLLIPRKS